MKTFKLVVYSLVLLVVAPIYTYLNMPVINLNFIGLPMELLFFGGLVAFLEVQFKQEKSSWPFRIGAATALVAGLYILVMFIGSWAMFRWDTYRNLIGEVEVGENFADHIAPVDLNQIRIVDQAMAERLGDKVLGEQPALGSQVDLGTFNIQAVNGKLYWVAPLLHSGFFKWNRNPEGTPGYVMVSATDERDVKLVTQVKGQPVRLRYQSEAYFGDYLNRHIYFSGYYDVGTTDITFEIDDEGEPYWVITLFTHKIGFSGDDASGVITVHAGTGEIKPYGLEDAPAWVDRIQPKEFIQTQLDHWGLYVNGFWNFSGQDQLMTTEGMSLVYGDDGKSYWYTGITSVGRDQGTVGFVLVNTRNKKARFFKQAGATEDAAMQSAQGKVQEKKYYATYPIMYNIAGRPTYVMSLKDQAGLVKMIAMVSVEDFSIVGVGDNVRDATRAYREALGSGGASSTHTVASTAPKYEGKIVRIRQDVSGGTAYYFLTLDAIPDKVFTGSSSISSELPLSQPGDRVTIQFEDDRPALIDLRGFDNLELSTKLGKISGKAEETPKEGEEPKAENPDTLKTSN